jgi:TRAP-type transport system periplasmic protein
VRPENLSNPLGKKNHQRIRFAFFACVLVYSQVFCFSGCSKKQDQGDIGKINEPVRVRIASLFSNEHFIGKKLDWVAAELEKRSGNRFQCQVFHGGVAGGEKENLEDLLLGNLELMAGAGSYFYHYCPEANVIELPLYNWKSRKEARDVIRGYWPQFVEISAKKGFYPVGLDIRDYWGIWYKKPIKSVDEIKREKFRSVNAEFWIEVTKLYGAIPNPMPYADAYMAFKTGVCDGVVAAVTNASAANWHEVLKCFLDTRLVLSESFMLSSQKWLNSLSPDLQEILLTVCKESEEFNLLEVEKQYNSSKEKMIQAGVVFVKFEDIELSAVVEKIPNFREQYMKNKGPEVYQFYKKWIDYVQDATGRPLL